MFSLLVVLLIGLSFGISLEEAIQETLRNSPKLKAWEERIKAFKGMKRSATAFPNPSFRFESGFITTDNGMGSVGKFLYLLEYNQRLPLWGVRDKRKGIVEELEKAFLYEYESEKRKLVGMVYKSFYRAVYLKSRHKLMEANYNLSRELEKFVERAYELGQASKLELLRAKRERRLAEAKLRVEKSLYFSQLKELGALIGKEVKDVEGDIGMIPQIYPLNIEELPQIKAIDHKVKALEKEIVLLKALAKPSVSGGFVIEDSEEGYYGLRASIEIELPIFYRKEGEIIEKRFRGKALIRDLEARKIELSAQVKAILERIKALKTSIQDLEREAIPEAEKELALALKGYREGIVSLFELTDVKRRYYEVLLERLNLLFELHKNYAEFVEIGGWR